MASQPSNTEALKPDSGPTGLAAGGPSTETAGGTEKLVSAS
jgi:hypothetical protein